MTAQPRSTKDGPFCWQTKVTRRLIRQKLPTNKIASALGVYDALTEIASDKKSDSFEATQSYIGLFAGVSGKTVARISPDLEELGLIAIKPNHIGGRNAECTWTVLPLGHNVRTPGHGRKQPSCTTIEEYKKTPQKNVVEEVAAKKAPIGQGELSKPSSAATTTNLEDLTVEELIAAFKPEFPKINVRREWNGYDAYCRKENKTPNAISFVNRLKRARPELRRTELPLKPSKRQVAPKREELPDDPVQHAEFVKRLQEWRAQGRPLGEFPTASNNAA